MSKQRKYQDPLKPKGIVNSIASWFKPGGNTAYRQADPRRPLTRQWRAPSGQTANEEIQGSYRTLRAQSRDLMRHNSIAVGARQTLLTNAVGPGLRPEVRIDHEALGMPEDAAKALSREVEKRFNLFARSEKCDMEGQQTFAELQALAMGATWDSGEVFCQLPYVNNSDHFSRLRIQMIEADRVDHPTDTYLQSVAQNPERVYEGIELTAAGAPARYYVKHWTYRNKTKEERWESRVPYSRATGSRQFLHLLHKQRPGQTRGVPLLAPVMKELKELGDYEEYEIRAALVAGLYTVFIESAEADLPGEDQDNTGPGAEINLAAGAVIDLAPGESANAPIPGRPNPSFEMFVTAIMRQIGMGLGIPYELLVKHFTASYSASRAALLEAWKTFRMHRQWLATHFCQPVFVRWMDDEVAMGRINAPGYFDDPYIKAAYLNVEWIGIPREELDPQKKAAADLIEVQLGTKSRDAAIRENSDKDFDQVHEQLEHEFETREEAGFHEYLAAQTQDADTTPTEVVSKGDHMTIQMGGQTLTVAIGDDEPEQE